VRQKLVQLQLPTLLRPVTTILQYIVDSRLFAVADLRRIKYSLLDASLTVRKQYCYTFTVPTEATADKTLQNKTLVLRVDASDNGPPDIFCRLTGN